MPHNINVCVIAHASATRITQRVLSVALSQENVTTSSYHRRNTPVVLLCRHGFPSAGGAPIFLSGLVINFLTNNLLLLETKLTLGVSISAYDKCVPPPGLHLQVRSPAANRLRLTGWPLSLLSR